MGSSGSTPPIQGGSARTYGGRVFDRIPRFDPRNVEHRVSTLLPAHVQAAGAPTRQLTGWQKWVERHIAADEKALSSLDGRVTALEGASPAPTPVPPTPTPVPPSPSVVTSKFWSQGPLLDQTNEGECEGFAFGDWLGAGPVSKPVDPATMGQETSIPEKVYTGAQTHDGSPHDEQSGASTLGAMQAATDLKLITAYHWALTMDEFVQGLLHIGPAIIGVNWYQGMMDIDSTGYIHLAGSQVGGHAICVLGADTVAGYALLNQAWGPWGINNGGTAKIALSSLATIIFAQQGDCVFPTKA